VTVSKEAATDPVEELREKAAPDDVVPPPPDKKKSGR
jgi:hypothetical protein